MITTIAAVCFALVLATGRLVVANLPALEGRINNLLAEQNIVIAGLRGSWHHFNPSLSASSVRFIGAELSNVAFEIDVVESLLRNRLIARHFIASGRIEIERTDDGWRLKGAEPMETTFDYASFLEHSDQLVFSGRVDVTRAGQPDQRGTVFIEARATNRGGRHRLNATLMPSTSTDRPARCDACELVVDFELIEALVGVRADRGAGVLKGSNVSVPEQLGAVFGVPAFRLDVEGRWQLTGPRGIASIRLDVADIALPGNPLQISLRGSAGVSSKGYIGVIDNITLATPANSAAITDVGVELDFARALTVWVDEIEVAPVFGVIGDAFGPSSEVGEWFEATEFAGSLVDVKVRLDNDGVAYSALGERIRTTAHRGLPTLANATASVVGHQQAVRLNIDSNDMVLGFPGPFAKPWRFDRAQGDVTMWFSGSEYLGIRGYPIALAVGESHMQGGFAFSRPQQRSEHRLVMIATADRLSVPRAKSYLPVRFGGGLRDWLDQRVLGGTFSGAEFVYQGHTGFGTGSRLRRGEVRAEVTGGSVRYHDEWPVAEALVGGFEVAAGQTRVVMDRASSFDIALSDIEVRVPNSAQWADVRLKATIPTQRALELVFATPIREWMPFVSAAWQGGGAARIEAELRIPLRGGSIGRDDIKIFFELDDATLNLVDLDLKLEHLNGTTRFRSPYQLDGEAIMGVMFGKPVRLDISTIEDAVVFDLSGHANIDDIYDVLDLDDLGIARGAFNFDARFSMFPDSARAPELDVFSDIADIELILPGPLAKSVTDPRSFEVKMQFMDDRVVAAIRFDDVMRGWIHADGGRIQRGSLGIRRDPVMVDEDTSRVALTGSLDALDMSMGLMGGTQTDFAWELIDLQVARVKLAEIDLRNVTLNGHSDPLETELRFESVQLTGSVQLIADRPWRVTLNEVRLPEADESAGDPIDLDLLEVIVAADVVVERIYRGDENLGSWRFGLRPTDDGLRITNLSAEIRGLHIEATEDMWWRRSDNSTHFTGRVEGTDLSVILPQWDYAASIESESAWLTGDLTWPGSPLNVELNSLSGTIEAEIQQGRFLDIEQGAGATRIFSLLNFSALAKRMSLDFSDVIGKGISFDEVGATAVLDDGLLEFVEPLTIVGTGSAFRIMGTIDFEDGALDNDMIVTLPVTKSLPWYAAWIALAVSPPLGAGILVGREIFGDQIDQISSARYRVTGTLDDPQPKFVGIFDVESPKREVAEQTTGDPHGPKEAQQQ
ncbi:MAG: DUF3971 domain-containing protein [Gammaproteobacteria bacterium]|nr:DUF3971 domain-containing protein [Gammaproteobacteria bacterium]